MNKDSVNIEYFGAAACKITTVKGRTIVIDPYIRKNPLCTASPDDFLNADIILVSHGASDHLGDTVEIMKNSDATLICGSDVSNYCLEMGILKQRIRTTVYGDLKEFDGVSVKTLYAQHVSMVKSETQTYYGRPMGFMITTENRIRILHTGDTSLFGDMRLFGMLHKPNVLLIGISRVDDGNVIEMNPSEAALATLWLTPDVVLPMHYPPASDDPGKFLEAVKIIAPNVQPLVIQPNSHVIFTKYHLDISN
ncbi:metal-dependent hydrolase [Chloroflexota bacterium]